MSDWDRDMLSNDSIHRVSLRGYREDTPALRMSVTRQLASADLRLPGMPPSAVLVVRKLPDPMPGKISTHPCAVGIDPQWERALRGRLEVMHARAARPRDGRIDGDAEAILFTDEPQMRACLALRIASPHAPMPWWRASLAHQVRADGLHGLLGESPELIPAVLSNLARWGVEAKVAATLTETEVRSLIDTLARALDLPLRLDGMPVSKAPPSAHRADRFPTGAERAEGSTSEPAHPDPETVPSSTRVAGAPGRPGAGEGGSAPWGNAWRSASPSGLAPMHQLFIGYSLALQREPTGARSPRFASEALRWLIGAQGRAAGSPSPVVDERGPGAAPRVLSSPPLRDAEPIAPAVLNDDPLPLATALAVPEAGASLPSPPEVGIEEGRSRRLAESSMQSVSVSGATRTAGKGAPPEVQVSAGSEPGPRTTSEAQVPHGRQKAPPIIVEDSADSPGPVDGDAVPPWGEEGLPTSLGGVLYLVNLMEHLDLPDCFEADCGLASAVGACGTLEAIARALLGPLSAEREQDALWTVLARLDQRAAAEPPRAEGLSVEALRLPPAWISEDAEVAQPLGWAESNGRLCVWSTAGYPLLEVALAGDARRQALDELSRYPDRGRRRVLDRCKASDYPRAHLAWLRTRGWPEPLIGWLERITPFLRWRLARALGVGTASELDLIEGLATLPARLYVTDTHIDVVASIDAIRMPLRLAGLDRSPGWVKSLLRVVLFHFE